MQERTMEIADFGSMRDEIPDNESQKEAETLIPAKDGDAAFAESWSLLLETMAKRNLAPASVEAMKERFRRWVGENSGDDASSVEEFLENIEKGRESGKLLKRFRDRAQGEWPRFPTEARHPADREAQSLDPQSIQRRAAYAYAANQTTKPWR